MVSSFYIKKFLDSSLEGQFFKKIQQLDEKTFRIQFNKKNFYVKLGEGFEISDKTITGNPSNFCMFMRKKLKNFKLKRIYQYEFDRVIVMEFENKDEKYYLVFELFGKGDLILCDKEWNIITSYYGKKGKYEFPERKYFLIKGTDLNKFEEIINKEEPVSKILARDFGIGRKYSEYLCKMSEIDPKEIGTNVKDINKLYNNFLKLFENPPVEKIEGIYEIKLDTSEKKEEKKDDKKEYMMQHYKKHLEKYEKYKKIAETIVNNIEFFEEIIKLYNEKKIDELRKRGVEIKDGKLFVKSDHCFINNNEITYG